MDVSDSEKLDMVNELFSCYYNDYDMTEKLDTYAKRHHYKPYAAATKVVEKLIDIDEEAAKFSIVIMAKNYLCFYDL
jgi:hypothetical protein